MWLDPSLSKCVNCVRMYMVIANTCTCPPFAHIHKERELGVKLDNPLPLGLKPLCLCMAWTESFTQCFCSLACCFHGWEKADCHYFRCSQYRYVTHVFVHDNSKHGKYTALCHALFVDKQH